MDIGTAKATAAERARVPHHLLDVVTPDEAMTAARWAALADAAIADIAARGRRVDRRAAAPASTCARCCAACSTGPPADPALRAGSRPRPTRRRRGACTRASRPSIPTAAARIDRQRSACASVRALEVYELTGDADHACTSGATTSGARRCATPRA